MSRKYFSGLVEISENNPIWFQSIKDFHFFKTGEVNLHPTVLNCGAGDDDEDDFDEGKKGQKGQRSELY